VTKPNLSTGVGIMHRFAMQETTAIRRLLAIRDWGYCDRCHASGPRRWNICKVCLKAP
jgi:hypothetical protein